MWCVARKPLSLTTTTTALPLTSSSPLPPRSEHLPTHFTLNDLIKLRPSSLDGLQSPHLKTSGVLKAPPQIDSHYSRAADAHAHEPVAEREREQRDEHEPTTQGPYEEQAMAGDDPAAYLVHERDVAEEAPSTAEPDATEHSVHASGMLAPPAY